MQVSPTPRSQTILCHDIQLLLLKKKLDKTYLAELLNKNLNF